MIIERDMTLAEIKAAARLGVDFAVSARFFALRMETPLWRHMLAEFAEHSAQEAAAFLVAIERAAG